MQRPSVIVGAVIVQRPHDIEDGYPQSIPIVYHYGHTSPSENILLYNQLASTLAQAVNGRCEQNQTGLYNASVIINSRCMVLFSAENTKHSFYVK